MKILKFGGTSLKDSNTIRSVMEIIKSNNSCGIVVSAVLGTTDQLLNLIQLAEVGESYSFDLKRIINFHKDLSNDLGIIDNYSSELKNINYFEDKLSEYLNLIISGNSCLPNIRDEILSQGEYLSACLISKLCIKEGLSSIYFDAKDLILTDNNFGNANVLYQESKEKIRKKFKRESKIQIIPGFIGATNKYETTTLGRNGSDYTASILGAALEVESIEIWTDVNGLLAANPKLIPYAKTIPNMTYKEAMELAYAGAEVIFPKSLFPVIGKNIPIKIKNTFEPKNPGTLIKRERPLINNFAVGISAKKQISLVRFKSIHTNKNFGMIGKVFTILSLNNIKVILVTQVFDDNTICLAITTEDSKKVKEIIANEIFGGMVDKISSYIEIENHLTLITIVGEGMRSVPGVAGKIFNLIGKKYINVNAISQGSSERNISFVVKSENADQAMKIIYNDIFSNDQMINVFIIGFGLVGKTLISLLKNNRSIRVCGICNSSKMVFNRNGLHLDNYEVNLIHTKKTNLKTFISYTDQVSKPTIVDATASLKIAQVVPDILIKGVSVVAANKIANSIDLNHYKEIRRSEKLGKAKFKYETNVGAGLPVIETIQTLINTDDKIIKIEGILSGTLSYLFSKFSDKILFSNLVQTANLKGFTEPDPRDDLNGIDVGRKILILAREVGADIELQDVEIQNLIPKSIDPNLSVKEFLLELKKYDNRFLKKYIKAKSRNSVLRYIAKWDGKKASAKLCEVKSNSLFYYQDGRENYISITTSRYMKSPIIIKGHGAGAEVTAAGIIGDLLKCK